MKAARPVAETLAAIDRVLGEQAQHRTRLAVDRLFAHPYHDDVWAEHEESERTYVHEGFLGMDHGGCPCGDIALPLDLFRGPHVGPVWHDDDDGGFHLSRADYEALAYQHSVIGEHTYDPEEGAEPEGSSGWALKNMRPPGLSPEEGVSAVPSAPPPERDAGTSPWGPGVEARASSRRRSSPGPSAHPTH